MEKRKTISYLEPQYKKITGKATDIPAIKALLEEFTEKAKHERHPGWYVKYAALYFTYEGKYYRINEDDLDTTEDIFEVLSNQLEDRLYELGAYDMFYSGMMD